MALPWYAKRNHMSVAHGLCLSFDAQTVWSIQPTQYNRVKPVTYALRGDSRPGPADLDVAPTWPPPKQAKTDQNTHPDAWSLPLSFKPRALVRSGAHVVTGGREQGQGVLQVVDTHTGGAMNKHLLPASPVWDGLAVAGGRLYIAMENGAVQCMKPAQRSR